jgi:hypothetical protein
MKGLMASLDNNEDSAIDGRKNHFKSSIIFLKVYGLDGIHPEISN